MQTKKGWTYHEIIANTNLGAVLGLPTEALIMWVDGTFPFFEKFSLIRRERATLISNRYLLTSVGRIVIG
jgi:hypothetical protein